MTTDLLSFALYEALWLMFGGLLIWRLPPLIVEYAHRRRPVTPALPKRLRRRVPRHVPDDTTLQLQHLADLEATHSHRPWRSDRDTRP